MKSLLVAHQSENQYPNAMVDTTMRHEIVIVTMIAMTTTMEDIQSIMAEVEVHIENTILPHERGDTSAFSMRAFEYFSLFRYMC